MATRKNYPGSIRRRGPSYQVRLHVGGQYHAFTVDAEDQAEAEAFARSKYNELTGAPAGPPPVQDEPFSALLQRFKATELPQASPEHPESIQRVYGGPQKVFRRWAGGPAPSVDHPRAD